MRAPTTLLSTITALFVHAQSHTSFFALGGQGQDDASHGRERLRAPLRSGCAYDDIVDMDPGTGQADQYSANSFLASYTTDHTYRWAYAFDGGGLPEAQLVHGNNGDVGRIAGRWAGSGELDPGPVWHRPMPVATVGWWWRDTISRGTTSGSFNIGGMNTESIAGLALMRLATCTSVASSTAAATSIRGRTRIMPFRNDFIQYNFLAKYAANGQGPLGLHVARTGYVFQKPVIAVDSAGNAYISGLVGDLPGNPDPGFTNTADQWVMSRTFTHATAPTVPSTGAEAYRRSPDGFAPRHRRQCRWTRGGDRDPSRLLRLPHV
ncbi:MAG: hypothetical protein IPN38_15550 [Flavobacteriales bacterium]|nr:hypothetical protein [Flavobacteriales bacterium]